MNQDIRNIAYHRPRRPREDHASSTNYLLSGGSVYRANQQLSRSALHGLRGPGKGEGHHDQGEEHAGSLDKDKTVNIVDIPGHADFGGEVERAFPRMVDGVLLVVDAYDGPLRCPYSLRPSQVPWPTGSKVVIVINKTRPRENARAGVKMRPRRSSSLLLELNATEEQFGRARWSTAPAATAIDADGPRPAEDGHGDPLFQTILDHIPAASSPSPDRALPHARLLNIDWSDYVGRIADRQGPGRRRQGRATRFFVDPPQRRYARPAGQDQQASSSSRGLGTAETPTAIAGSISRLRRLRGHRHLRDTLIADCRRGHALPSPRSITPTSRWSSASTTGRSSGREGKINHLPPTARAALPRAKDQCLDQGRGHRKGRRLQCEGPRSHGRSPSWSKRCAAKASNCSSPARP